MATWALLTEFLRDRGDIVELTWADFDRVVGGVPPSATNHSAWWSGDRPHTRAWRAAGFRLDSVDPGRRVSFHRVAATPAMRTEVVHAPRGRDVTRAPADARTSGEPLTPPPDLVLVSCVKSKRTTPTAAKDLYTSALFRGERGYAESTGAPWFVLSAEHGLLAPDDIVAPYERYLPDESPSYRRQWGDLVLRQIEERFGGVDGSVVEIHAGSVYVGAIAGQLRSAGAAVVDRLQGKTLGQRLAWYSGNASQSAGVASASVECRPRVDVVEVAQLVDDLRDEPAALTPAEFLATRGEGLRVPGLYSWWVDTAGVVDFSAGLGQHVDAGLIYAGLAGATRWPSGKRSSNTLWSRISGMHLGSNRELSTFRMSLCGVLFAAGVLSRDDEQKLTAWMGEHLRVIAVPFVDADELGRVEEAVLRQLDPPLNLRGMAPTAVRERLTVLRRTVSHR